MIARLVPRLSLRQKIIHVLVLYVAGIGAMGLVSYLDLRTMEEKQEFMRLGHSLNNLILEIRRYEKNYLLYGQAEDLEENRRYLDQALAGEESLYAEAKGLRVGPQLAGLRAELAEYRTALDALETANRAGDKVAGAAAALKLREIGKAMNDAAESVVDFERDQIRGLVNVLKIQLFMALAVAAGMGVALPLLAFRKVFRPLGIIRKATLAVALGRYKEMEVVNTNDEIEQVMEAMNRMVAELDRRQDQLVQSKKLSSIGTLTAGVAHQLNNPLNNISTSCQIALEEFDSADPSFLKKMLRNIDQETLRARDIVQGLLEFSRAREFSLKPTALAELVERTLRLVSSQVPAGVRVSSDIPPGLTLPLDAPRLQEALLNLIINALQAMDGKGMITVTARTDAEADEAVLTVRDTGPGIPRDIQSQIFDPFYTTKEEGHGTGLGLSIVYGIVQQHAGSIAVESKVGEGAAFVIRLPLTPAPLEPPFDAEGRP